ncbi:hypothetical protein ACFQI7_14865 [Paenibacillus allorhizosphaerae]|uniref:Uncharacterized protein n=1 Tax=Paenibacillus allorhizosphaerae TaxID=2849866 RepID=A0ABN7THP7_9BACL|nr:hypothetical protein [Paenibacillus allorhizosphaerae]CAG7627450.1 hypothetical protein PAECIP111802_01355 [Paenibacillus allorhizosphaerae]
MWATDIPHKVLERFGEEYPVLKTKNVQGIFKSTAKTPHKAHKYDDLVRKREEMEP